MTNARKPSIELLTEKTRLLAGQTQTVDLLVRITPPTLDDTNAKRAPLNLSIVLDRSGSMGGRKMEEAKAAAKGCIDKLLATDRISAVTFDHQVDVLIPSQPVTDRYLLNRAINSIQADGSTALHEGWVKGGLEVSEHLDPLAVNRVLLITDGQANVGETRNDRIVDHARRLAKEGVSTSTIGIGADFNEDLLMPMAEAGQGNAWHVQEPQDIGRIFETEVSGLLRQFGYDVTLKIAPGAGIVLSDVMNDFEQVGGRYRLPNLIGGEPLRIVVRLMVPSHAAGETIDVVGIDLKYVDQATGTTIEMQQQFSATFAPAADVEALPVVADVVAASTLLMNARARREAMERLDQNDERGAMNILMSVADLTGVAYARAPVPELGAERDDLDSIQYSVASGAQPASTRKRLAYRRESLRKSR